MQQNNEVYRSELAKERAHRRKKHREVNESDDADPRHEIRRSFRQKGKPRAQDAIAYDIDRNEDSEAYEAEEDTNYQQQHMHLEHLSGSLDYPNQYERRQPKQARKPQSSKHRRPLEENEYVNADINPEDAYSDYAGGYPSDYKEYENVHARNVPVYDENFNQREQSILSSSQRQSSSGLRHSREAASRSQQIPLAESVTDYDAQSGLDATPLSVGGNEQQFWNPNVEPGPGNPQSPQKAKAETKPLQKLLASFRRLKHKDTKTSVSQKDLTSSNTGTSVVAKVIALDGEEISYQLDRYDTGEHLFSMVCSHADIVETDYFGLTYVSNKLKTWFWLDLDKKIAKQLRNGEQWTFCFQVKFYPPEPTLLQEDITRYQLTLQVRQDIYTGKLPCSWVTQALLGSFMVQAELGDYDEAEHGNSTAYLKEFEFVPSPTPQLLQKIAELHKTHIGMKPSQADVKYLETAKRLELYGIDLHPARDMEDVEIYLGVGFHGIVIYRDRLRIGRFAWPKVLRISYKKNNFYLKIRPDNTEPVEAVIGFRLLNHHLANRLWKAAVEHHAFFRLKEAISPRHPSHALNPTHAYTGHTFFQYRTMNIHRPHPHFNRSLMKRRTASMPTGLNQSVSMHSLNRAHPRDMTVGRTQESDGLGFKRFGSGQISSAGPLRQGHAGSTGQLYSTVPRGTSQGLPRDSRSQLSRQTGDSGAQNFTYTSRDLNYSSSSHTHDYVNYDQAPAAYWPDDRGSSRTESTLSNHGAQRGGRTAQTSSRRGDRQLASPLYVNAPGRRPPPSNGEATFSELSQQSGYSRQSQSRGMNSEEPTTGRKPPIGGVPALGGLMLQNPSPNRLPRGQTAIPHSTVKPKHQKDTIPREQYEDEPVEYDDEMDEEYRDPPAQTGYAKQLQKRPDVASSNRRVFNSSRPKPEHYVPKQSENTELML